MVNKENENTFCENVKTLVLEMEHLSDLAVEQNTPLVDMALDGYIMDEDEIAHIMDCLLDWCQFDNGLQLFKKLCRGLYYKYPMLVTEYVLFYRKMWEND